MPINEHARTYVITSDFNSGHDQWQLMKSRERTAAIPRIDSRVDGNLIVNFDGFLRKPIEGRAPIESEAGNDIICIDLPSFLNHALEFVKGYPFVTGILFSQSESVSIDEVRDVFFSCDHDGKIE